MERGLLWLPLLAVFVWLAWLGWNEYQKIEAYRQWAEDFEQAKYDIFSVLAKKGKSLTWGKPTRLGPVNLQTFSLEDVKTIQLLVNNSPVELDAVSRANKPVLEFSLTDSQSITIPFTQLDLAVKWAKYLIKEVDEIT
jgi:hypothetical protein